MMNESTQEWTDEELWQEGERYTQRLQRAEAVCDAFSRHRAQLRLHNWDWADHNLSTAETHYAMCRVHDTYLAGKGGSDDGT